MSGFQILPLAHSLVLKTMISTISQVEYSCLCQPHKSGRCPQCSRFTPLESKAESSSVVSAFEVFSGVFPFAELLLILDFQCHKDSDKQQQQKTSSNNYIIAKFLIMVGFISSSFPFTPSCWTMRTFRTQTAWSNDASKESSWYQKLLSHKQGEQHLAQNP